MKVLPHPDQGKKKKKMKKMKNFHKKDKIQLTRFNFGYIVSFTVAKHGGTEERKFLTAL